MKSLKRRMGFNTGHLEPEQAAEPVAPPELVESAGANGLPTPEAVTSFGTLCDNYIEAGGGVKKEFVFVSAAALARALADILGDEQWLDLTTLDTETVTLTLNLEQLITITVRGYITGAALNTIAMSRIVGHPHSDDAISQRRVL